MKKNTLKWLLVGATACMSFSLFACNTTQNGPEFLEGSLEKIKIGSSLVLGEYVDYVTDGKYTIEIVGENGYRKDVTNRKVWTPEEPGEYSIVYTVLGGEKKGVSTFDISVTVPKMSWSYTVNNALYDVGQEVDFEEFFDGMNIAAISYYPWEMVMDSVTVNGVTTEIDRNATSYLVKDFADHTFRYHIETEDGQTRYAEQVVAIRYTDEETMAFLEENNMYEHNAVVVAEGKVVLNAGEYGGGNTTGAPRASMLNEQAYLAYEGNYGLGDFVAFDFTGQNMPAIGFFMDNISDSMFYCNDSEPEGNLDKGIVLANGATQNNGSPFGKWTGSVCNRLNFYGPRKIANMDSDTEGWFRRAIKGVDALTMTWQANNPDTKFRMVVGFVEGTSSHATVAIYMCNRETGEVYYNDTFKLEFDSASLTLPIDENYYTGSIVAYGHYGKRMTFDKLYPVVHADSLDEAVNTLFEPSKIKKTASLKVPVNEAQKVSDYIVTVAGYTPTLKLVDTNGVESVITQETFTLPQVGEYYLIYNDGKNNTIRVQLTACNKYEISTAAEFLAMPNDDPYAYCVLTQDINFEGIVVNGTAETQAIERFTGVLDGCGHKIYNVTMIGSNGENGIMATLFRVMNGTIKNLYAELQLSTEIPAKTTKQAALINVMSNANALVENCYVKMTSNTAAYSTQIPVAAIVAYTTQAATIRNCVAVFECTNDFAVINGGYATIVGRVDNGSLKIENCYGVVLSKDNAQTAKLYCDSTYAESHKTPTVINSSAYVSFADMFVDAKADVTEENGWNSCWSIDATMERLTFGTQIIYNGKSAQLNVNTAKLYLVENSQDGLEKTLQLSMLYSEGAVSYVSSDLSVATVDENGLVTAKKGGTATITATVNGVEYTCSITVYSYHEISTATEFLAMPSDDAYAYCVLTQDVNFAGIVVNGNAQTKAIANFIGILDGKGHKVYNVTLIGPTGNGIQASLFLMMNGTIKNLSAELGFSSAIPANSTKHAGLISTISLPTALVENCYVKVSSNTAAYGTQIPVAAVVSYVSAGAYAAVVKNCVAVFECTDNFAVINGGYATVAGRVHAAGFTIENCYGVVLSKDDAQTAKLYCDATYASDYKTPQVANSTAYTSFTEMLTAVQADMTADNGWNELWTVGENSLKFGQTVVYQA